MANVYRGRLPQRRREITGKQLEAGEPYPELCAQRTDEAEDPLCWQEGAARPLGSFSFVICLSCSYIPLRGERQNSINQLIRDATR